MFHTLCGIIRFRWPNSFSLVLLKIFTDISKTIKLGEEFEAHHDYSRVLNLIYIKVRCTWKERNATIALLT